MLWGGQLHDNIIMRMKETGLPVIAQDESTVYITSLITGENGGDLIQIFIEIPVRFTIYKRKYAPNFHASSFKVDMADAEAADRLVDRLLDNGYVKHEVFPPYTTPTNTNNVAYSPLSMVTARMAFKAYFDTMLDTQCQMKLKGKINMIKEARKHGQSPAEYLSVLMGVCVALNLTGSITEVNQLKEWLGDDMADDNYCWATILLWEIRLSVQIEMAAGDFELDWIDEADGAIMWELPFEIMEQIYVRSPAKGWLVCERVGDSVASATSEVEETEEIGE
jgi:hypothetical protein